MKKKFSFWKLLIWIVVIVVALQIYTEGDLFSGVLDDSGISTPTGATDPTTPSVPSQADRLPNIPEELWDHVYLKTKAQGPCKAFTGNVTMLVVFVNDPDTLWSQAEIEAEKQQIGQIVSRISQDAQACGADLNLTAQYEIATADIPLVRDDWMQWAKNALQNLALVESGTAIAAEYEAYYHADAVPIVFMTNQSGRSLAQCYASGSTFFEGALLYKNSSALYHEICHVFGAKDFYFPDEVQALADTYLLGSIMSDSAEDTVDSLTAYLIGWTDSLPTEAMEFLQQTAYLTPEYLAEQKEIDSYTGYVENFVLGSGVYTGYLVDGVRHGQGIYTTDDGTVLEGNFIDGQLWGQGSTCWADGTKYVGNYENGIRNGEGTMYYPNGSVYVGQWLEGSRYGYGRLTFEGGTYCEGNWIDGSLNGQGSYVWASGDRYDGAFKDGKRNGYGIYYFASGGRFEGNWLNGDRHGYGTYYFADGSTQSGTWENDEYVE